MVNNGFSIHKPVFFLYGKKIFMSRSNILASYELSLLFSYCVDVAENILYCRYLNPGYQPFVLYITTYKLSALVAATNGDVGC